MVIRAAALTLTALVAMGGLAGCGDDTSFTMPDLTGQKLDAAYAALDKAGVSDKDKINVDGGGVFGIVDESNWTVCKQSPSAGQPLAATAKLVVDRSCEDDDNQVSDQPSDTATEKPSPDSTPTGTPTLNAKNSPDLAAALRADSCDDSLATFSKDHYGDQITFDGSIVNLAAHGDATTRFDMLVGPGDAGANTETGPSFQFTDKNAFDLNLRGPNIPDNLQAGQKYRFVATVGDFDPDSCLFELQPVTTTTR